MPIMCQIILLGDRFGARCQITKSRS